MQPVAIIGVGCLAPGAETAAQLWQQLLSEFDAISTYEKDNFGYDLTAATASQRGTLDKTTSLLGGWIKDFKFDPTGYAMDASEVSALDEPYQWALYIARQALLDSGYLKLQQTQKAAIILGAYSWGNSISSARALQPLYSAAFNKLVNKNNNAFAEVSASAEKYLRSPGYIANIMARALALQGPVYSLDAACASSLYAIKCAMWHLQNEDLDFAIAGGAVNSDPFFSLLGFSAVQALPAQTRSRPLNAQSSGLAPAQGGCLFVLKNLEKAKQDGDSIYAVIRGIGLSNDGSGQHVLTPNKKGQLKACERAYQEANINLLDVDYIDLHATGTELGDSTELNTISGLATKANHWPYLGAIKSNVGHMLTAAGAIGALKCIYAMREERIPATIGIDQTIAAAATMPADRIVRTAMAWPTIARPKRAAINAFGFGGTNAHMILEADVSESQPFSSVQDNVRLAITGMDGTFGAWQGISELATHLYAGEQAFTEIPTSRWQGLNPLDNQTITAASLTAFEIDGLRYRIPPNELAALNPTQLLMLKVADQAILQAGIEAGTRTAVIIGMGFDLSTHRLHARWRIKNQIWPNATWQPEQADIIAESVHAAVGIEGFISFIGNILASRIAALWDFSGPAFTISAEENSVMQALELARYMLINGEAEAVVLGGIDFTLDPENVFLRQALLAHQLQTPGFSFEQSMDGMLLGEGAGAIVLQLASTVAEENVIAYIDAATLTHTHKLNETQIKNTAEKALQQAGITAREVDYLEANANHSDDQCELAGLQQVYGNDKAELDIVLGSVKSQLGHTGAAAGMAAILHAALCLSQRYLPTTPHWQFAKNNLNFAATPFYLPMRSYPWFAKSDKRIAAISNIAMTGSYAHLIMSATAASKQLLLQSAKPPYLVTIIAENRKAICDSLEIWLTRTTERHLQQHEIIHLSDTAEKRVLCLLGNSLKELEREAKAALTALNAEKLEAWQTPAGSYYTEQPQGVNGKVCFVYPGINNCYPLLGIDAFQTYHGIAPYYEYIAREVGSVLASHLIYPRSQQHIDPEALEQVEMELMASAKNMTTVTAFFSTLYTRVLSQLLALPPHSALGYSGGESNLLIGNEVWSANNFNADTIPLIDSQLEAPYAAAKALWQWPENKTVNWAVFYLLADKYVVAELVPDYPHVYLTHVNTHNEVIIAGELAECEQLIARLACDAFSAPANLIIHCAPVSQLKEKLLNTYGAFTVEQRDLNIYFGAGKMVPPFDAKKIAQSLYAGAIAMVDFPHLIEQAYAEGNRIFIEVGPSASCTRLVSDILAAKPHVALAFNHRQFSDHENFMRLLAVLYSHQVINKFDFIKITAPKTSCALPLQVQIGKQLAVIQNSIIDMVPTHVDHHLLQFEMRNQSHVAWLQAEIRAAAANLNQKTIIFDEADVMEFAEGKLSHVFGEAFSAVDDYAWRLRLPTPPFMALSRVLKLDAKPLSMQAPAHIVTECDIATSAWYAVDGQVPMMAVDAQGVLFLLSYLGVDIAGEGKWIYRWLNSEMQFFAELPKTGDILRYEIVVESFARDDDALLCFSTLEGFVGDKKILRIGNTCAGFFTKEALLRGKNLGLADELPDNIAEAKINPLLKTVKKQFSKIDLKLLQRGELVPCFGNDYESNGRNKSLRLAPGPMLMIDRISQVHSQGGGYGHGYVIAEKDLHVNDWYLRNHFKDLPVLAGPCMLQAATDLLQFYLLYVGAQTLTQDTRFQFTNTLFKAIFRKQVAATTGIFTLRADIKKLEFSAEPFVIADVHLIYEGEIIGRFEELGMQLREKTT